MPSRKHQKGSGISRRDAIRFLASASALPLFQPVSSASIRPRADVGVEADNASWRPRFLDPEDVDTVASLSECVIPSPSRPTTRAPSSGHALVCEYIDAALDRAEPAVQKAFRDGLSWLDRYAAHSTGRRFIELDRERQLRLLAAISDTSRAHEPKGYAFLTQIKQLTIEGYYRSDVGVSG